ncbi:tetratricopeptide repeat protein 16 [Orussus abietinus]|uniref:tetratricopeptide repeat protein 16 n=1 Tax=Orussus abietinus TaxID=222816 RepID=UPI000626100A|nr:tetratricopeptide repeat protein 16 [Orussus abietinus]
MEVMELAEMRKVFMPSKRRYEDPHKEAVKLRTLWAHHKPPNRLKAMQMVKDLYSKARKEVENENYDSALASTRKALFLDPRHHAFYALRGDVYSHKGFWSESIKSYEKARLLVELDRRVPEEKGRAFYVKKLIDAYWKRGNSYLEQDDLLEALGDYEEILVLLPRGTLITETQDKILAALKSLEKYEAYRYHWMRFMVDADKKRASSLLTHHAEYRIYLSDMAAARHMLFEALDIDSSNSKAQELLQVVFDTGHTMVAYAVIWCFHGCYDKALLTIEKGRDCDPYNPGYTLLKAIILRLSGRLTEAKRWLQSIDQGFYKLLEPSRDMQGSIVGNLTIDETRDQLIKQWHLIRYDLAVESMLDGCFEKAYELLKNSDLRDLFPETYVLMGDCLLQTGKPKLALKMYEKCRKKCQEKPGCWADSQEKRINLVDRISSIVNLEALDALMDKRSKLAIKLSRDVRETFRDGKVDLSKLPTLRGEAYLNEAQALYQLSAGKTIDPGCKSAAADGFVFTRTADRSDLRKMIFGNLATQEIVEKYAAKRKLPHGTKLLMQFS